MGNIMIKISFILLIIIGLINPTLGQIVYDTIPNEEIIGTGIYWEKSPIIRNVEYQLVDKFTNDANKYNLNSNGRVFVETIFGKDGTLKNTRIVKGFSRQYDSLAFYTIYNLNDWLPGIHFRGYPVDIPYTFVFSFGEKYINKESIESHKEGYKRMFGCTDKEYLERKKLLENYTQK